MRVTNDILVKMGVTPEQLHTDALENAPELRPVVIKGMSEVMIEMMGPDAADMFGLDEMPQDEKMYVATACELARQKHCVLNEPLEKRKEKSNTCPLK